MNKHDSNITKILSYINTFLGKVFGPDYLQSNKERTPQESEKSDIAQGGEDIEDTPPLEDEKPIGGKGLKIMTPKQMNGRLPILLAQLKAGNNSKKLKNEVRQMAYSLYSSKNLSKTAYNHLVNKIKKWKRFL